MITNQMIGLRLRRMRKASGMSQTDLAKILDCDQASVSRLESGTQGISTTQLITISNTFKVDLNSIGSGLINYWDISRNFERKPKIKKRYQSHLETHGREIIPILQFLNADQGTDFTSKLLTELGLNDLMDIPPDGKVSVRCYLDLVQAIVEKEINISEKMKECIQSFTTEASFGSLIKSFTNASKALQVTKLIVLNDKLLDSIFEQKITEYSENHLLLFLKKRSYLQGVDLEHTQIAPVLLEQKRAMHEVFPKLFCPQAVKVSFLKKFKKNLTGNAILKVEIS